jgi:flagellar biosynthesis/type III secretory pathway chaperone
MKTQAEVLQMLAQQKSSLLATYPITKIGIFGF